MSHEPNLKQIQKEYHGSLRSYLLGFTLSLGLTLLAFGCTIKQVFSKNILIYALVLLALIQAIVQLRCFLKLGHEASPRWETVIFYFMFFILLVIAVGSLWIMIDLNDRMMND